MKKKTSWSAETIKTVERWTCDDTKVPNQTTKGDHCKLQKIYKIISHRIHVCYNIYHQYTPNVSYIPAPWILWVLIIDHSLCNPWPVICPSPNQATENDRRVAALASCRVGKTTAWTQKRRSEWLRWRYPSGKRSHNYGKSQFFMGKSTISMAMFNSYVSLLRPRNDEGNDVQDLQIRDFQSSMLPRISTLVEP